MLIHIANPIYDSVFKFMMEDKRVARTLISALLKKEVIDIDMRRHEYTNGQREKISMFRIDFGAKVREADGSEHFVLIELQKTWLETETLRFRQYLGAHYSNPENMHTADDNVRRVATPMVAIYLLGHRVGDISEPVLYVSHGSYDYDGRTVTQGVPDPFVESLTHDSIIVQIPLLPDHIGNRVEKVLSVFNQRQRVGNDNHTVQVDDDLYADDADMEHLIHRLLMANSDAKLRQDMNIEDEYFSAIENRDTKLMKVEGELTEAKKDLAKKDGQIAEQQTQIAAKDNAMRQMAKALLAQGMPPQAIAAMMGTDEDTVCQLADEQ